jgi:predicted nucleotidyltransferase
VESLPLSLKHIHRVVAGYFAAKPVRRVQVFGSYAQGEATAESDLNLLIELVCTNIFGLTMRQPGTLYSRLCLLYNQL